jgi:hypothetical protein
MEDRVMLRTLLVLVLLAPTTLLGQKSEKPVTRRTKPGPVKPSVTAEFQIPGQKRASLPTGSNTFSELRAAFLRNEEAKAQDRRRRVEEHVAQLQRAGGLQALWKRQLEEASRVTSKERTPRLEKLSADLRVKIESFAICKTPTLYEITDLGEPNVLRVGSVAVIHGCHLGESAGTVRLHAPSSDMDFSVTMMEWHDSYIEVFVGEVSGVLDQTAVLQVRLPSADPKSRSPKFGAPSNSIDVFVRARRDVALIAARPNSNVLTVDCADSTDYDRCASLFKDPQFQRVDHSIGGIHWSSCCFNGVSGTDHYFVSLKNGWVLDSEGIPPGALFDQSIITCNPPYAGDRGHVDPPTGFTPGAATTTIDVHWWVDANCSEALYLLDVFIEGPIGVPFE